MKTFAICMVVLFATVVLVRDGVRHFTGAAYCGGSVPAAPAVKKLYL
jgi:hypothetical protein